jgi:hypothetical protein
MRSHAVLNILSLDLLALGRVSFVARYPNKVYLVHTGGVAVRNVCSGYISSRREVGISTCLLCTQPSTCKCYLHLLALSPYPGDHMLFLPPNLPPNLDPCTYL